EKILESEEPLRRSWPISGTTGYDFLALVNRLFVDADGARSLTGLYQEFTSTLQSFEEISFQKRLQVLHDVLDSDVNRLTARLVEICETHRDHRDYTRKELHDALVGFVAAFPVYRTYIYSEDEVSELDKTYIEAAVARAQQLRPDT